MYRIDKLFHIVWTTEWKIYFSKNSTKFEFFFHTKKFGEEKKKLQIKPLRNFLARFQFKAKTNSKEEFMDLL